MIRSSSILTVMCFLALTLVSHAHAASDSMDGAAAGSGFEWASLVEESSSIESNAEASMLAAEFEDFVSIHNREYASASERDQAFLAFSANYRMVQQLNQEMEERVKQANVPVSPAAAAAAKQALATSVVKTTGPIPIAYTKYSAKAVFADLTHDAFRARFLNVKYPHGKDKGRNIKLKPKRKYVPQTGAGRGGKAAGFTGVKSGKIGGASGHGGKAAGFTGVKSGKIGGESGHGGKVAGFSGVKSGKIGGAHGKGGKVAGFSGVKSGKIGGVDGKRGVKSGKIGGGGRRRDKKKSVGPLMPELNALSPEEAAKKQSKLSQHFAKSMVVEPNVNSGKSVGGVSVATIRAGMAAQGMNQQEIDQGFASARYLKMMAGSMVYMVNEDNGIQNQVGKCGSCWAFSAIDATQRNMKSTPLFRKELSVQQILDCVRTVDSHGCKGGSPMDAWDYLASHPIALSTEYPLRSKTGSCRESSFSTRPPVYASTGWEMAIPACHDKTGPCLKQIPLEALLLEYFRTPGAQPLVTYVDGDAWQSYKSGIFDVTKCKSTTEAGNHLVLITGSNTDTETGIPYWLIQNSWGSAWGMVGRIMLPMFVNACGMANFVVSPLPLPAVSVSKPFQVPDSRKESDAAIRQRVNTRIGRDQTQQATQATQAPSVQRTTVSNNDIFDDPFMKALMDGSIPASGEVNLAK